MKIQRFNKTTTTKNLPSYAEFIEKRKIPLKSKFHLSENQFNSIFLLNKTQNCFNTNFFEEETNSPSSKITTSLFSSVAANNEREKSFCVNFEKKRQISKQISNINNPLKGCLLRV